MPLMQAFITAVVLFVCWFVFGMLINAFSGWITYKRFKRYYPSEQPMKELERDLLIRNMREGYRDPTNSDLLINALFWPRTQFYSWIGNFRILKDLKQREAEKKKREAEM